mgnify:FL=1|jgi:hypothetical protein
MEFMAKGEFDWNLLAFGDLLKTSMPDGPMIDNEGSFIMMYWFRWRSELLKLY